VWAQSSSFFSHKKQKVLGLHEYGEKRKGKEKERLSGCREGGGRKRASRYYFSRDGTAISEEGEKKGALHPCKKRGQALRSVERIVMKEGEGFLNFFSLQGGRADLRMAYPWSSPRGRVTWEGGGGGKVSGSWERKKEPVTEREDGLVERGGNGGGGGEKAGTSLERKKGSPSKAGES